MSKLVFKDDEGIEQALAFLESQQEHIHKITMMQSQDGVEYDKQPTVTETEFNIELDAHFELEM